MLLRIPAMKKESRGRWQGGEDGGQVRRPERPRLSSAEVAVGPPVAGEDPSGTFPGRARFTGEADPEAPRSQSWRLGEGRRPRAWSSSQASEPAERP